MVFFSENSVPSVVTFFMFFLREINFKDNAAGIPAGGHGSRAGVRGNA